jgi:hypothetical protein
LLEAGCGGVLLLELPNTTVGMASGADEDPQADSTSDTITITIK